MISYPSKFELAAQRSDDLASPPTGIAEQYSHLREARTQRRIADLDWEHRILQRGESGVRALDSRSRRVHDALRIVLPHLGMRCLERVGGETVPAGELGV
jgi:hypothetical protein